MKILKFFILLLMGIILVTGCSTDETTGPDNTSSESDINLLINEFLASNDAATTDENGEFDDWVEFYNPGTEAIDIGGMWISDDAANLKNSKIPTDNPTVTTIPAGGFIIVWFDGQPEQGALHISNKLSSGGEDIVLTESNGISIIDSYTYGPQTTDVSYGRTADGGDVWAQYSQPTPGASNSGGSTNVAPVISSIGVSPDSLTSSAPVIISAVVTDANDNLQSVTITYGAEGAITTEDAMTTSDSVYTSDLGIFADGSRIFYYITATDDESAETISDTLFFEVGYVAPVLFINEFMASNDSANVDEYGEYEDWIEIYNPGSEAIDIGGMYITDDLADLPLYQIPETSPDSTTIPAGGFLLLYADKQPEQGILHVNIKLSGSGEQIGLAAPDGVTVIDSLTYDSGDANAIGFGLDTDMSCGRQPDGSDNWIIYDGNSTPGESNN